MAELSNWTTEIKSLTRQAIKYVRRHPCAVGAFVWLYASVDHVTNYVPFGKMAEWRLLKSMNTHRPAS
jgi:hypothetical protein